MVENDLRFRIGDHQLLSEQDSWDIRHGLLEITIGVLILLYLLTYIKLSKYLVELLTINPLMRKLGLRG